MFHVFGDRGLALLSGRFSKLYSSDGMINAPNSYLIMDNTHNLVEYLVRTSYLLPYVFDGK